ncbi:MAG: hypothetical protein IPN62_17660 [Flavobacteriales bacterium]|nr:hypothetical protein [Flavobacteriales bacterium]
MNGLRSTCAALALFRLAIDARSQGCSDAGVCTAGPIGELHAVNDSAATEQRHFARLTFSVAGGEEGTTIMQVVPELSIGVTERLSMQLKVPYLSVSGNLGSTSGLGDPVLTASYAFIKKDEERLDGLVGVKVPSGDANTRGAGLSLPMPYQTSLGTTDLLLGITYRWKRISGAIAYQHVLAQNNANGFTPAVWAASADSAAAAGYFSSFRLERANDAVLRAQYAIPWGRLVLQPGLLGIIHLAEDVEVLSTEPLVRRSIAGTAGTTLNLTVDARYRLNDTWSIEAAVGSPLVVREVRPDGLTRSMVLNLGLRFAF